MTQALNPSFWIGGVHSVQETLAAGHRNVLEVLVDDDASSPQLAAIVQRCRSAGIKVRTADRRELDRLCGGRHQGVAAKIAGGRKADLAGFLAGLSQAEKRDMVLVALDQIQDPHNLGAIARSAVNLGAAGLILPERRASPVTAVAVAASAGAIQKTRVFQVVNLGQALSACREAGFWIYGADAAGEPVWSLSLNRPLVLVIGSEGEGMRRLTRDSCDALVSIPQAPSGVESFNASCAASILLYEIRRQGTAKKTP